MRSMALHFTKAQVIAFEPRCEEWALLFLMEGAQLFSSNFQAVPWPAEYGESNWINSLP